MLVLRDYWCLLSVLRRMLTHTASLHLTHWTDCMKRSWDFLEGKRTYLASCTHKGTNHVSKAILSSPNQHPGKWHGDPSLMLWGAESQAEPCSNSWPTKPWHVFTCSCLKMLNFGTAMEEQGGSFHISLSPIQFTRNEQTTDKPSFE